MKPTQRIAMWSLAIGAAAAAGARWFVGEGPWWAYLIFALMVAGAFYQAIINQVAKERVVDRDHTPR